MEARERGLVVEVAGPLCSSWPAVEARRTSGAQRRPLALFLQVGAVDGVMKLRHFLDPVATVVKEMMELVDLSRVGSKMLLPRSSPSDGNSRCRYLWLEKPSIAQVPSSPRASILPQRQGAITARQSSGGSSSRVSAWDPWSAPPQVASSPAVAPIPGRRDPLQAAEKTKDLIAFYFLVLGSLL